MCTFELRNRSLALGIALLASALVTDARKSLMVSDLLTFVPFNGLFAGTAAGFVGSALLVIRGCRCRRRRCPPRALAKGSPAARASIPTRRGFFALNLVATAGVRWSSSTRRSSSSRCGRDACSTTFRNGPSCWPPPFGLAELLAILGLAFGSADSGWSLVLGCLGITSFFYSAVLTPLCRLLRRSAAPRDRNADFAAQFALSRACWLLACPLAGRAGASLGFPATFAVLALLALAAALVASRLWPARDPEVLVHDHDNLAPDHPHLVDANLARRTWRHRHVLVIEDNQAAWPA